MFSKNIEKKKLSVDFEIQNYNLLTTFGEKYKMSNSQIINYLIEHFLKLSGDSKNEFAANTKIQIDSLKKIYSECQEFEANQVSQNISLLEDLLLFFTDGKGYRENEVEKMKRIEMLDSYVVIPNDWIVVENKNPQDCKYAGVIEIRNSTTYNMPHLLFFCEVPIIELTTIEEERILSACEVCYPDFKKIRTMQVKPVYDENKNILNSELWEKAPTIGLFPIHIFGEDNTFPCGSMIVRTNNQ